MEHAAFCAVLFVAAPQGDGNLSPFLSELLFRPAVAWTVDALAGAGAERFFLVCAPALLEPVRACFPPEAEVVVSDGELSSLCGFLRASGGKAVLVTEPVYLSHAGAALLADAAALPQTGGRSGLYRISGPLLADLLEHGETTGSLADAGAEELLVSAAPGAPPPILPLRDPGDLLAAQAAGRCEILARHLGRGVRVPDPNTVYIDPRVKIGRGTRLLPGTILRGDTVVGEDCEIGPNSMITSCSIGNHTTVNASQCVESTIGNHVAVGPFAYVRPHCRVGDHVKLGDFVEVKNSVLEDGAKVSHLTYVGDADIGAGVNLGCGTVTVNYDGTAKFRTVVGADAFIGCNTNLVAPVHVGAGAYVAAGSTITRDVPAESLAIARTRQTVKERWAARKRMKPE